VLDAGNGMAGRLLGEVFGTDVDPVRVPFDVIGLFTELDGTFPNHEANPLKPENLVDAARAVVDTGADLGLVFDGDADRCFFIDETGATMSASGSALSWPNARSRGPRPPAMSGRPSSTTSSPPAACRRRSPPPAAARCDRRSDTRASRR